MTIYVDNNKCEISLYYLRDGAARTGPQPPSLSLVDLLGAKIVIKQLVDSNAPSKTRGMTLRRVR